MNSSSISGWGLQYPAPALEPAFAPWKLNGRNDEPLRFPLQRIRQAIWYAASLNDQLNQLSRLADDWDGYGAAGIEAQAVTHAQFILPLLAATPDHLLPSAAGTILIEWESMLGRASLELGRDTFSFYTSPAVGDPILLGGTMQALDVEDINYAVATIAGKVVPQSLESNNWRLSVESVV